LEPTFAGKCRILVEQIANGYTLKSHQPSLQEHYDYVRKERVTITPYLPELGGVYEVQTTRWFNQDFVVEVIEPVLRELASPPPRQMAPIYERANKVLFESYLRRLVSFATQEFRRRGWSEEFIESLQEKAVSHKLHSKYIVVRGRHQGADEGLPEPLEKAPILGVMRIVDTQDQKLAYLGLPMEETLRIDLDGRRRRAIEPGNFAILEGAPEGVFGEIGTHLLAHVVKERENTTFFTYGDETSIRYYRTLGFKVVEDLTPKDQPIVVDGNRWWVLTSTRDQLKERYENLNKIRARFGLTKKDATELRDRLDSIGGAPMSDRFWQGSVGLKGQNRMLPEQTHPVLSVEYTIQPATADVDGNIKEGVRIFIRIDSQSMVNGAPFGQTITDFPLDIFVPSSQLPLKPGAVDAHVVNYPDARFTYNGSALVIGDIRGNLRAVLVTLPNIETIYETKVRFAYSEDVFLEYDALF
jgi:hypothetical protein